MSPPASGASAQPLHPGISQAALGSWRSRCMHCHGTIGAGDGPEGVNSRDLTDPRWQDSRTDAQLGEVIRTGRGSMPAFDLPEDGLRELVALIRLMRADRAGPDAAPHNSQAAASAAGSDPADAAATANTRASP